jgi:hypothetical protein
VQPREVEHARAVRDGDIGTDGADPAAFDEHRRDRGFGAFGEGVHRPADEGEDVQ